MLAVSVRTLLVVSATAQAAAAIAVAIFTWRLVRFTRDYVEQMRLANELQSVANAQQHAYLQGEEATAAPNIVAAPGGGSFGGDRADVKWGVRNVGGSVASSILLRTPIGEVQLSAPLGAGESDLARLSAPRDSLPERDAVPDVVEIEFTDSRGTRWRQRPGEPPQRTQSA